MLVLTFVDRPRLLPWTAAAARLLVTTLVLLEAPVSGTSLNPARTIAPALVATVGTGLWLYLVAPPLGAVALRRRPDRPTIACAKVVHPDDVPCHFLDCQYTPPERGIRRFRQGRAASLDCTKRPRSGVVDKLTADRRSRAAVRPPLPAPGTERARADDFVPAVR